MSTTAAADGAGPGPLARLLDSSVGSKVVVGLTGMVLVGWLVGHLSGNLLVFAGQDAVNAYAAWLHSMPAVIWGTRVLLLLCVVLHVVTTARLTRMNRDARPQRYRYNSTVESTLSGRTMIWSGMLVLAYVVYHLLHMTWGVTDPEHFRMALTDPQGRPDVFSMLVHGFQQAPVAIVYIVANVLLGLHLSHGVSSFFQTLGVTNKEYRPLLQKVGPLFAGAMATCFVSIPAAVMLGLVTLP